LRGRKLSEKLPKIPRFGSSLIYQLRLLESKQHPQSGVHLTLFSTWGTENSMAEINLESTGVIKVETFFYQKIGKHLQLFGRAHYRSTCTHPSISQILFPNPKNHSLGGCSKILLSFLMRSDGHF
jgi:hypothetical protein